ncbi:MAG TPA: sigma-70 family RNA polymerase sigma factor [Pirellulales bacterium]|jgi:RNA polymerase sigma-70 factor (ECF subfamily)|nr:sigma-70 family RNA polymerase sigma factor [Pirellulales bacterium]
MAANKKSLAERLARGEESAFAELYDVCANKLRGFLLLRLHDPEQAAEVLQITFVRAVEHRKRFANVENPTAYLFQMARNEAVRNVKKDQSRRYPEFQLLEQKTDVTANPYAAHDDAEMVAAALAKLDIEDRELVELKIFAGLTFQEIAAVTAQPPATVATRYRRALESLRPWLSKQLR